MPGQVFRGLWWPRSHNITEEVGSLLAAADAQLGAPMIRMSVSSSGWDHQPRRLYAGTRLIRLGWFTGMDPATAGIGWTPMERIMLCVIPSEFPAAAARRIFDVLQEQELWPTEPSAILEIGSPPATAGAP